MDPYLLFPQLVYEPHIAPRVERWAEEYIAKREARRRQRDGSMPVPNTPNRTFHDSSARSKFKRSDSGTDEDNDLQQGIELEKLVAKEVHEWRSEVDRSQPLGLRHRKNMSLSGGAGPSMIDTVRVFSTWNLLNSQGHCI